MQQGLKIRYGLKDGKVLVEKESKNIYYTELPFEDWQSLCKKGRKAIDDYKRVDLYNICIHAMNCTAELHNIDVKDFSRIQVVTADNHQPFSQYNL